MGCYHCKGSYYRALQRPSTKVNQYPNAGESARIGNSRHQRPAGEQRDHANRAASQPRLSLPQVNPRQQSFMAPPGSGTLASETELDALSTSSPALNPNTTVESSSHPPNMPTGTQDSAAKPTSSALKRKITANNKLKTRQKRVKRESDASMLQTGGGETSLEVNKAVKRAQTRGKLAMLPSLPFDVLFEIFGQLSPTDIMHLSRTTKTFRRHLLHKSAMSLWKSVCANAVLDGVPACPEGFSLPAWTNLLFSPHCHNCLAPNIRSVEWMLRVRLCVKCSKNLLISIKEFKSEDKVDRIVKRCIPFEERERDHVKYCLKSDREAFLKELQRQPGDRNEFVRRKQTEIKARKEACFFTRHAKMCQEWFSALVVARNEQLDQIRIDRYNFIHDRLVKMGYKLEFEFLWDLDSGRNVVPPLPDLKPFRSHAEVRISKPITERTWNSRVKDVMVEYMEDAKKHRLINGRRLLLLRRSASALQAWLSWLAEEAQIAKYPPGTLLPTPVDFVQSQCVQLSIHQDDNAELFPTDFASAIQKFTTTLWEATDSRSPLDSWREAQEGVLWDLICDNLDDMDTIPDISEYFTSLETEYRLQWLQLAVVTFSCNTPNSDVHRYPQIVDDPSCAAPSAETIRAKWRAHGVTTPGRKNASNARDPMWYPEFFHHSCCKLQWTSPADESFKHNNLYVVQRLQISPISWIRMQELSLRKTLRFDHAASKTVKNILVACGLNWERTKVQDLDEIDPRVICLKCSYGNVIDGERRFPVRTWRNAVKHSLEKHWGSAEVRWQRLSDQDASNARKKEKFERLERCARTEITPVPRPLRCLLCRDSPDEAGPMTWDDMCDHLVGAHGKEPWSLHEGTNCTTQVWDTAPVQPLTVTMVPLEGYPLPPLPAPKPQRTISAAAASLFSTLDDVDDSD